jgi:hypothetical protein
MEYDGLDSVISDRLATAHNNQVSPYQIQRYHCTTIPIKTRDIEVPKKKDTKLRLSNVFSKNAK